MVEWRVLPMFAGPDLWVTWSRVIIPSLIRSYGIPQAYKKVDIIMREPTIEGFGCGEYTV
jgi:hypothetical protein